MKLWVILGGLVLLMIIGGCVDNESTDERYFIEGGLFIDDAENVIYGVYPLRFDLLRGQKYTLEYTAEKWMYKIDGEMKMNVSFPDEFKIIDGDLEWSGTDKKKKILVTFIPTKNGDYFIESQTVNLDFFIETTGRNLTDTSKISVYVREPTISSMMWRFSVGKATHFIYRHTGKRIDP